MSERDELKKKAQEKLSEAWRLIHDAGELAKQGQFPLHFGEVGDFIPRSFTDRSLLRIEAIESLKATGRPNGSVRIDDPGSKWGYRYEEKPPTPWNDMNDTEREIAIEDGIDALQENMEIPSEVREFGIDVADMWWAPSRC